VSTDPSAASGSVPAAAPASAAPASAAPAPASAAVPAPAASASAAVPASAAAERPAYTPRGNKSVGDIARSLLPLVVLVVLAVWVLWPRVGSRVQPVDPSGDLRDAARIGLFAVESPQGLPSGWHPTSSDLGQPTDRVLTIQIGYLTPAGKYATYVQSNVGTSELLGAQIPGSTMDGTVQVAGQSWQRYRTGRGEAALVRAGPVTLLVTGSANLAELTTLAASLR
jgi:Protein of unknown function (DUF4245)